MAKLLLCVAEAHLNDASSRLALALRALPCQHRVRPSGVCSGKPQDSGLLQL